MAEKSGCGFLPVLGVLEHPPLQLSKNGAVQHSPVNQYNKEFNDLLNVRKSNDDNIAEYCYTLL